MLNNNNIHFLCLCVYVVYLYYIGNDDEASKSEKCVSLSTEIKVFEYTHMSDDLIECLAMLYMFKIGKEGKNARDVD